MPVQNVFKDKLVARIPQYGNWVMTGSEVVCEALAYLNYDFQVLDLEQPGQLPSSMPNLLRACATAGQTQPLVRLPSQDPVLIKQYLDFGAHNLMFPSVETPDIASNLVEIAMYPPFGNRGVVRMTRASRFTMIEDYPGTANDTVCLIAQLDSESAMQRALEIGKVPGINGLFVCPGDLSTNMGITAGFNDATFRAFMTKTLNKCRANGIPMGTVCPSVELAQWAISEGCCFVAVGSDIAWLMQTGKATLAAFRACSATT